MLNYTETKEVALSLLKEKFSMESLMMKLPLTVTETLTAMKNGRS